MQRDQLEAVQRLLQMARREAGAGRRTAIGRLLQFGAGDDPEPVAVEGLLRLCREGTANFSDLAPFADRVVQAWKHVADHVKPAQQAVPSFQWMLDDEYAPWRSAAECFLDLLQYFPGAEVDRSLHEGLRLTDPRLKLFATISLLRRSQPVSNSEVDAIAASNEVREILWEELTRLGSQSMMPARWAAPQELAASALSRWLSHPNELNAPPEEIELMDTFSVELDEGGVADVFLFRFREFAKPWQPGGGWMAGIAGRYRDGRRFGSPRSAFKTWESMLPREHFERLYKRPGLGCGE